VGAIRRGSGCASLAHKRLLARRGAGVAGLDLDSKTKGADSSSVRVFFLSSVGRGVGDSLPRQWQALRVSVLTNAV